jgi:hypothetical protein
MLGDNPYADDRVTVLGSIAPGNGAGGGIRRPPNEITVADQASVFAASRVDRLNGSPTGYDVGPMLFMPVHLVEQLRDVNGDKIIVINGILPSGVDPQAVFLSISPEMDSLIMHCMLPKEFTSVQGGVGLHSDLMEEYAGMAQCLSHASGSAFNAIIGELKGSAETVIATASIKLPVKVATREKIRREFFPSRGNFVGFSIDLLVQHASTNDHKKRKASEMMDFFDFDD